MVRRPPAPRDPLGASPWLHRTTPPCNYGFHANLFAHARTPVVVGFVSFARFLRRQKIASICPAVDLFSVRSNTAETIVNDKHFDNTTVMSNQQFSSTSSQGNLLASGSTANELELADRVRALLAKTGAAVNGSSLSEVFNDIPQFVVVGAQSSGKSSILSRLSGVEFPTKSERCTRVATVLKLRRKSAVGDSIKVCLFGKIEENVKSEDESTPPTNTVRHINETFDDAAGVSVGERISRAQCRAIELAGAGDGFVDTLEIIVSSEGPKLPNVTLVDLPGLIAPKPDSKHPETVDRMVKRYAEMRGSLILNVVPLEQDYDTGLGKSIVTPLLHKTIFVFTKLDILATMGPDIAKQRLDHIMRETDGGTRVVALGTVDRIEEGARTAEQDTGTDPDSAPELSAFDDVLRGYSTVELGRGCNKLASVVEERMKAHLLKQMPILETAVRDARQRHVNRLEAIQPRPQQSVLLAASQEAHQRFNSGGKARTDFFRELREELGENIQKAPYDHMRRGPSESAETFLEDASRKALHGLSHLLPKPKANLAQPQALTTKEEWAPKAMAREIRSLVKRHQGLRNLHFVDPQPIVEYFAETLAKTVHEALSEANSKAANFLRQQANGLFKSTSTSAETSSTSTRARKALLKIASMLRDRIQKIIDEGQANRERIVSYNRPPLVFTTNTHYLEAIFAVLMQMESLPPTDETSAEVLYLRWVAYRKVQIKMLVETASKDLVRTFLVGFERAVTEVLAPQVVLSKDVMDLVAEQPLELQQEEQRLKVDIEALDAVLAAFL